MRIFYVRKGRQWPFMVSASCLLILVVVYNLPITEENTEFDSRMEEAIKRATRYDLLMAAIEGQHSNKYLINWHNPPFWYTGNKPEALYCGFESCEYSNCRLTLNKSLVETSDAVIIDARLLKEPPKFKRPPGQVWIFAAHEPLVYFDVFNTWKSMIGQFNWTMSFDNTTSDIFMPYGELIPSGDHAHNRDFKAIAENKTKDAVWLSSRCDSHSKREKYVNELKKYIGVTVYGDCGEKFYCGLRHVHNTDCFAMLNTTFRYYLAFENSFCRQYITEKFFDNYNNDAIMITRGGEFGEAQKILPENTHISTDSFKTIAELGKYLKSLSESTDKYAEALRAKSRYYSPGFKYPYQKSMCELCKMMNHQDQYRKVVHDLPSWYGEPCRNPKDIV